MRRPDTTRWSAPMLLSIGLAMMLLAGGCTGGGRPRRASPGVATGTPSAAARRTIPQPVVVGLPIAPQSARVDLALPTFSNPTKVTNPLFPVSKQESVLLAGHVEGKQFRTEVTLLPYTRIIEWQGVQIECLVSQYVAFLGGRIQEVAYDLYAQADDGSVWYFGEDVIDFRVGVIFTNQGTWLVNRDGPPAMIMPGDPQVGQAYRAENIPGIAFEEVTVKSVGQTVDGPTGPITGVMVGEELHMDGTTDDKTFAPGYGELATSGGGDLEALALAVPTDSDSGPVPPELEAMSSGALSVFDVVGSRDWSSASTRVGEMAAGWVGYAKGNVPQVIESRLTGALSALATGVAHRNMARARQAAIETARWSLDLQLRFRPPVDIDLARFDLWAAQVLVDAAARDEGAVTGDSFTLVFIRDRIIHGLSGDDVTRINVHLDELQTAAGDANFAGAAKAASQLRETIAGIRVAG